MKILWAYGEESIFSVIKLALIIAPPKANFYQGMRVLITGGAGFIGSHLADAYLARGDDVFILDDLSAGSERNVQKALKNGAHFLKASILSKQATDWIDSMRPDLINHHAAQKSVRASIANPILDAESNILGTLKLLEASTRAGCKKFIFASSGGAIYGEQKYFPADEFHPCEPISPYGASKLSSEIYLNIYSKTYGLGAKCLRYANVYGPRQDPNGEAGVVAIFSKMMLKASPTSIFGDGKQTRDFVYVKDIVNLNLAHEPKIGSFEIVNVGTGKETSICSLHKELSDLTGYQLAAKSAPTQEGDQKRSAIISNKIDSKFFTPLNEGLRETIISFKSGESQC